MVGSPKGSLKIFLKHGLVLAPPFFPNVSTSSDKRRKLKRKVIFNSCLNLIIFLLSLCWLFMFHECPLAGNTWLLSEIFFLLFSLVTSAGTACNEGVSKPAVHDLSNSSD